MHGAKSLHWTEGPLCCAMVIPEEEPTLVALGPHCQLGRMILLIKSLQNGQLKQIKNVPGS